MSMVIIGHAYTTWLNSLYFNHPLPPRPALSASAPLNQLSIDTLRTRGNDRPFSVPDGTMHGYLSSPGHRQIPALFPQYCHRGLFLIVTSASQLYRFEPSVTGFPNQLMSLTGSQSSGPRQADGILSELSSTQNRQASIICL